MNSLHVLLPFGRPVEDLPDSNLAAITFDEALSIADLGDRRWHSQDIDQQ